MTRRRLQGAGALQIQQDRWLLPSAPEHEHFLNKISSDLARQHATGHFSLWQAESETQQRDLIHRFQLERQQEYDELINQEQQFLQAMTHDMQTKQWTFAKLEAHEQTLHKLSIKLRSIQQRAFFSALNHLQATNLCEQCDQAVYEFAIMVYTYSSP